MPLASPELNGYLSCHSGFLIGPVLCSQGNFLALAILPLYTDLQ